MKAKPYDLIVKIGKRKWYRISLIKLLAGVSGKSNSDIKRLFKQKAIDIYIDKEMING